MHGYFDESGNAGVTTNGLFVVAGIWAENSQSVERFMRKWLRNLVSNGYGFGEIKGRNLTPFQLSSGLVEVSRKLKKEIQLQVVVLEMNSLMKDHRLFHPRKWTETDIHQAILYEMLAEQLRKQPLSSANIAIDGRHTLPRTFFSGVQSVLRKQFANNLISVFRGLSQAQRGIQLADVLCNSFYSKARSVNYESGTVERMMIQEEIQFPVVLRIGNPNDLLSWLSNFQQIGGPL